MRFGHKEIDAVTEVIRSGELSPFFRNFLGGGYIQAFEGAFAEYHGVKYAIATNSGTSALHTALLAAGVGAGDEVITTPYTFVASASSILMCRATPVFSDVSPRTYNIMVPHINASLTVRTKAILPVHLLGHPCDMENILITAKTIKVPVIEDCAQALGARYNGQLVGTIGDLGCFSFQQTKTITTGGEGGMIITDDKKLAERCRWIRNHGEKYADAPLLGYNYRMTEMQAAMGLVQLEKLDELNKMQIRNAQYMCKRLPEWITPPYVAPYTNHVYFLIGCQYDEERTGLYREAFIEALIERGVAQKKPGQNVSGGYDQLVYEHSVLQPYKRPCPIAEDLVKTSLWIDLHRYRDRRTEIDDYIQVFKEVIENKAN